MLKQFLLILMVAGLVSVVAPLAGAQDDSQSNDQKSAPAQGQGQGRWRHGPPDPAERTQQLTKQLNLTADQQSKVQEAFQSERTQMESLRQNSSLSQDDRRSKMMDIRKTTDTQVRALLDSNQQKKWDEMQARREKWMQNRRPGSSDSGSGSGEQAPPQPQ